MTPEDTEELELGSLLTTCCKSTNKLIRLICGKNLKKIRTQRRKLKLQSCETSDVDLHAHAAADSPGKKS